MSKHEDYDDKPRMKTEILKLNDEDGQYYPYETWFEKELKKRNKDNWMRMYHSQWIPSEDEDDSKS